jgi:hypothetical protein
MSLGVSTYDAVRIFFILDNVYYQILKTSSLSRTPAINHLIKFVSQSRNGLQIYEGHDDQLNRPGPMA